MDRFEGLGDPEEDRSDRINSYLRFLSEELKQQVSANALVEVIAVASQIELEEQRLADESASDFKSSMKVGVIHRDGRRTVVRDIVRWPDGSTSLFLRLMPTYVDTFGAAVLPIFEGNIVLLKHYRVVLDSMCLEIPRGFGERGEGPAETARRELFEEIVANATKLVDLGEICPDSGLDSTKVRLFYAEIDKYGLPETKEGVVEILLVNLIELESMLVNGEITDGFTMGAFLRARLKCLL